MTKHVDQLPPSKAFVRKEKFDAPQDFSSGGRSGQLVDAGQFR
jgi:hypothetical protein